jgi:tetratricopeptide (TPR) repeat protein
MFRISVLLALTLALTISGGAQSRGGPSIAGPPPNIPTQPPTTEQNSFGAILVSGKVAIDDGSVLTDSAAIQSVCQGRTHVEAYTDSKGRFSFQIKSPSVKRNGAVTSDASDSSPTMLVRESLDTATKDTNEFSNYLRDCQLRAVVPGFTSSSVEMSSKARDVGPADVGTLTLHRMAQVQGFTLSATSAQAPHNAAKHYDKGREHERKSEWNAALASFQKAVAEYPKYAVAWLEMGRVQEAKGDVTGARQSLQQALAADSKFVSPYHELAQIAAQEQKWQEVVDDTDQLLKLNPVSFPHDWWLNAVGYFNLKNYDAAEKGATRGLEADTQHEIPRLEYLLGMTLVEKHDFVSGVLHLRNYVRLAPHALDVELVRKQADDIERASAQAKAR